jgi:hypothetical protein
MSDRDPKSDPGPDAESGTAPADGHHRRRWWLIVVAALGAVVVAAIGIGLVLFFIRDQPKAKSVGERVDELAGSSTSVDAGTSTFRPPAGVYVAEGAGHEAISFPPVSQEDGATMPASVEYLPEGCWRFRIDYNEAHWQDWTLCPAGALALVETEGHTWQNWDLGATQVANLSTFSCDPPSTAFVFGADEGATWDRRCEGTNDQVAGTTVSSGTMAFEGTETLTIDGEDVKALRFRREHELSGAQTGAETVTFWVAAKDGLPLRSERDVRADSSSPVGTITYTESGHWQLTSLTPEG